MNRTAIALVSVLASLSLLHSGKTDGNGGHYDSSAGEYHYHHGYSAHDHYDMDGDRIVDCPYTFKGNTNPDPKDYDSFEEWSNAKYGISKDQEEEDEKKRQAYLSQQNGDESSNKEKKGSILETVDSVLCCITIVYMPWVIKEAIEKLKEKFTHRK